MDVLQRSIRTGYAPLQLLGTNAAGLLVIASGASLAWLVPILAAAIALSFTAERVLPYEPAWNRSHGDAGRDAAHAVVNEVLSIASVASIPIFAALGMGFDVWPHGWPFMLQLVASILVLDAGIALCHFASHRFRWLWRFHAIHHSVKRLYGLNGLMKHPVHQAIETAAGTVPLVLLGMPFEIGAALAFCTAVQLLVQHSNVDYRLGPLRRWIAGAEIHRLHHRADAVLGDVNFGLFTTLADRALGTLREPPPGAKLGSADVGIAAEPAYPTRYFAQLARPFAR